MKTAVSADDLLLFHKVALLGSVSYAADSLEMPKSSLSRRLSRLEKALGVQLLSRSPRGIRLTDSGMLLFDHCSTLSRQTEEALSAISYHNAVPQGHIKLSIPIAFVDFIMPIIAQFMDTYPQVSVALGVDNRRVDLIREGYDIAIRIGKLDDSGLIARRLGSSPPRAYAAPGYLQKHGTPRHPSELAQHKVLDFRISEGIREWVILSDKETPMKLDVFPQFCANEPTALCQAAILGQGIVFMPQFIAKQHVVSGRLVPILPGWYLPGSDFYAIFASHRIPLQVRVLIDFLVAAFASDGPALFQPSADISC